MVKFEQQLICVLMAVEAWYASQLRSVGNKLVIS